MTSRSLLAGSLLAALLCGVLWHLSVDAGRGARESGPRARERTTVGAWIEAADEDPLRPVAAPAAGRVPSADPRVTEGGAGRAGFEWYGRVVDAQSGAPLEGATLHVRYARRWLANQPGEGRAKRSRQPNVRTFVSAADGRFPPVPAVGGETRLVLEHPDFERLTVPLQARHHSREQECVIALARAATLAVVLHDARAHELAGYTVRARPGTTRPAASPVAVASGGVRSPRERKARTAADGRCELTALAPDCDYDLALLQGERCLRKWPTALVLAPGEYRELAWELGTGCWITGTALDPLERPIAELTVELSALATPELPEEFADLPAEYDGEVPRFETHTDAAGRFQFEDVAPGTWWVAVPESGARLLARERLEIGAGEASRTLTLRVQRGLAIRGTVLAPSGGPAARCLVIARALEREYEREATSDRHGNFTLEPLWPGPYTLALVPSDRNPFGLPQSDVPCAAGDEGLVLRLAAGGMLAGRVVDGGGNGVEARVVLDPELSSADECAAGADGSFQFLHLEPGLHRLFASGKDGFAVRGGLDVAPLARLTTVELALEPGARLVLALPLPSGSGAEVEVWSGAWRIAQRWLEPGESLAIAGPPGPFLCKVFAGSGGEQRDEPLLVRQFVESVALGETKRIELQGIPSRR